MTTEFVESDDLHDLLSFENIDFFKVTFSGEALIDKDYLMVSKEIWNGVTTKIDTFVNTAAVEYLPKISNDTFTIKVLAKKTFDNYLKLSFKFPGFGTQIKRRAINSDDYSLRDVGTKMTINSNQNFYAFAYILPYETERMKMWCAVEDSGEDIENWGQQFGIEHYVLFEMKFH